ncbi:MAG: hypothetical protein EOP22_14065 [Hyphomicrobiales bacterium]|nr:MAG: hypothetical protein EOP22_14065 [Hyphomicrobiales bacterium]
MSGAVDLTALYTRQLPRLTTENQRNRLRIALENRMTAIEAYRVLERFLPARQTLPAMLAEMQMVVPNGLARQLNGIERRLQPLSTEAIAAGTEEWALNLRHWLSLAGKCRPEPFVRRRIARSIGLYGGPGAAAEKALTIVFCASTHRPTLPVPVYLQHLEARATDVLILRDPAQRAFAAGVGGSTSSLAETIDLLRDYRRQHGYRQLYCLGTSAGGLAALATGLALGATAIMTVGAGGHDDSRQLPLGGVSFADVLVALRQGAGAATRLAHAYGADVAADVTNAERNRMLLGGELVPIRDGRKPVGHAALYPLAKRRRLGRFFAEWMYER